MPRRRRPFLSGVLLFLQRFWGEPTIRLEDQPGEPLVSLVPRAKESGQGVLVRVTHRIGLASEDEDSQFFPGAYRAGDRENRGYCG